MSRWFVAAAVATATASLLLVPHAYAAADAAALASPGFMTKAIVAAQAALQAKVDGILGSTYDISHSSTYTTWARDIFIGAFVIKLMEQLARWILADASFVGIVETIVMFVILSALYATYGGWTRALLEGGQELGILVQNQAGLGNGLMAPSNFLFRIWAQYTFHDSSWFSLGITSAIDSFLLIVMEVMVTGASFVCCTWPVLIGAVAVIIGPVCFVFAFHESVSFIFNGFLRLFFWCVLATFVARVCIVVACITYSAVFTVSLQPGGVGGNIILLDPSNLLTVIILGGICILTLFLLFYSAAITSHLTSGSNLDVGGSLGKAAKTAAAAIVTLI